MDINAHGDSFTMSYVVNVMADEPNLHRESSTLKDEIKDFSSNTTLHGIKFIFSNKLPFIRRLIWVFIMLTMTVCFSSSLISSIRMYYSYESIISTHDLNNLSLELPSVTICNNNIFKKTPLALYGGMELVQLGMGLTLSLSGINLKQTALSPNMERLLKSESVMRLMDKVGIPLEDLFVECSHNGRLLNCSNYITQQFTNVGFCYTFNYDTTIARMGTLKTTIPGTAHGLTFILNIDPDEYLFSNGLGKGVAVVVQNPYSFPLIKEKKIFVQPGTSTQLSLKRKVQTKLTKPYSLTECIPDNMLAKNANNSYGRLYSEEGCQTKCMTEKVFNCNCSFISRGPDGCTLYDYVTCSAKKIERYLDEGVECETCLPTCEQLDFKIHVSKMKFPNFIVEKYAAINNWPEKNLTEIQRKYCRLDVFYETLDYTHEEQVPAMVLTDLFAQAGGQFGLFLGASLITVLECITFIFTTVFKFICQRNSNEVHAFHIQN